MRETEANIDDIELDRPAARESKRDRIIRIAGDLFLEKGYDNLTINEIIEATGGSKGTIYSKFGNKEKLLEAVVDKMCRDVTIRIEISRTGTLEDQLTRIGHSFLKRVLSPEILRFHRLMTSIGRQFPEAGRLFYDTGPRQACGIIASWIAHCQETGSIRDDEDPFHLAILFHDMLIGDQMLKWLTSAVDEETRVKRIDDTVRLAVKLFLQGCAVSAK
ncbi:TetR/AcrR family transcriptional regulator [Flavimaribacter sediminis]|uniref:TetR/AcrR family transcriptional regulator n=1 Tax=Flavimaribacter sediminis TaxID=2865987 RepID=UPI001C6A7399|nr:TetR/AcrR family transcriptional regulator [Flavimaribacter sediminis]